MAAGEGGKIIVTTRSRRVFSMMHPMYTHHLQILSDEECWSIMERHISLNYGFIAPILEAVGRNIARKCKGLPLAASTVAGILSSGSDLNHWEEVLNSSMWDLEESNLPAALSLSYYFLPTNLKQCFAYCSVFPKDFKFDKQRLIQLWITEGFIRWNTTRMKDKGGQQFDDLLHRSFFQHDSEDKDRFVMHDLVHDLALAVSGEVYGRSVCGESCHTPEKSRYLSMCCVNSRQTYQDRKTLSTLILLNHRFICSNGDTKSFRGLRYLRVLDLYQSGISMLPNDIGNLKYLRFINLSYASSIRRLPDSLCDLHNLQSLILCHSGISELPRGMKYLRNLQHLDIYGCRYLCSLPQGIGRLNSLKTLSKFPISKDDDGCGIRELKELRQLAGVLSICSLENVNDPLEAREADLINKPKIDDLTLSCFLRGGDSDIDEVFESLRPHTELKSLHMNGYYGLTFPRWLMIELPSYKQLVYLTLTLCWKCRVLPPIGELPLLESLCIDKMFELEKWSSSSRGAETEFPSLLRLTIGSCSALRVLPQPLLSSPRLCELSINKCPRLRMLRHDGESKLTSLKNLHLGEGMEGLVQSLHETETLPPNLNHLYIHDCKSLPKGLRNLYSLQQLKFSRLCKVCYCPEELPANVIVTRDG